MDTRAIVLAAILASAFFAVSAAVQYESDYQALLCDGMLTGRTLPDGTKPDCLSDTHAIEVDWTHKWPEAIGQSLHYAAATGLHPGLILVCKFDRREELCLKHAYLAESTLAYWNLGATMWLCPSTSRALADCRRKETIRRQAKAEGVPPPYQP